MEWILARSPASEEGPDVRLGVHLSGQPGLYPANETEDEQRAVGSAARNALDLVEGEAMATGTGGPRDDR